MKVIQSFRRSTSGGDEKSFPIHGKIPPPFQKMERGRNDNKNRIVISNEERNLAKQSWQDSSSVLKNRTEFGMTFDSDVIEIVNIKIIKETKSGKNI